MTSSSESPSARDSINQGILALGDSVPKLVGMREHVTSLWSILGLADNSLRPVFDELLGRLEDAKGATKLSGSAGSDAHEKLNQAATNFLAARGSGQAERAALPDRTTASRDKVADFMVRLNVARGALDEIMERVRGARDDLRNVLATCAIMADDNGEINEVIIDVGDQTRIAAELSSDL